MWCKTLCLPGQSSIRAKSKPTEVRFLHPAHPHKVEDTVMSDWTEVCKGCQGRTFEARQSGPHVGIYCCDCGKWLCWEQQTPTHDPNFIMPYGIHKGKALKSIPTDYLDYGARTFTGSMMERFKMALAQRYKDFGRAIEAVSIGIPMVSGCGDQSLKAVVDAFSKRFHIDAGRVHQYLALYDKMAPKGSYRIIVCYREGQIRIEPPKD